MIAGRDEQIVVLDGHRAIGHVDMDVGVQLLDFLGLRRGSTVGEDQSVAGELVITRAIAEVSAIAQTGGAVRLGGIDRLIDEVPDEAAPDSAGSAPVPCIRPDCRPSCPLCACTRRRCTVSADHA